jgi:predicted nucleic acid-binding Zn ribbon protein
MFCRFCGKQIPNDSGFCEHCGANLLQTMQVTQRETKIPTSTIPSKTHPKPTIQTQKLLDIVYYIGIIVFVFTFGKMSPGWGFVAFLSYVGGVVLYIWLTDKLRKRMKKTKLKKDIVVFLVFVCIIAVGMITMTAIYNSKVDVVMNSTPTNGEVKVRVSLDEDFYTYFEYGPKTVSSPSSKIKIGDNWYNSGDVVTLKLNTTYPIEVCCRANSAEGISEGTINLQLKSILDGYSITKHMSNKLWSFSAEVTAEFERVVSFWEVIFY